MNSKRHKCEGDAPFLGLRSRPLNEHLLGRLEQLLRLGHGFCAGANLWNVSIVAESGAQSCGSLVVPRSARNGASFLNRVLIPSASAAQDPV